MDRYQIQKKVIAAWHETWATEQIKAALKDGRETGDGTLTVDLRFKWIADDIGGLYDRNEAEAAACYSYLSGWLDGSADIPKLRDALDAIQARIVGEWDHPALLEYGELHTDPTRDILRMVESV